ncbi:MAG: hypothetical protein ACHQT8_02915 [Chlamydiales bacterium]
MTTKLFKADSDIEMGYVHNKLEVLVGKVPCRKGFEDNHPAFYTPWRTR